VRNIATKTTQQSGNQKDWPSCRQNVLDVVGIEPNQEENCFKQPISLLLLSGILALDTCELFSLVLQSLCSETLRELSETSGHLICQPG
jgi:hypothetical protein